MAKADEQRLAWDGVSFRLPAGWDFAGYEFRRGVTTMVLDDIGGRRAHLEWMRPGRKLDRGRVEADYAKREGGLGSAAERHELTGLPSGWRATLYRSADGHGLIVAWYLQSLPAFYTFWRLYFSPQDPEPPQQVIRQLSRSLRLETGPLVPWCVYDMSVTLPADFRLWTSSLEAGRKLLVFQARLQRLFIWQFSLADRLLAGSTPHEWAAGFLNRHPLLHGPRYVARENGDITAYRTLLGLCHFDEIGRLCFRYHVGWQLDAKTNRLLLWVWNHRRADGLNQLPVPYRSRHSALA